MDNIVMIKWKVKPKMPYGVLCGSDKHQEWLLPWWWERYRAENDFPVTFVDFGMTEEARLWCEERGDVVRLDLDMNFIKTKEEIDSDLVRKWDTWIDWISRPTWFKKPFALLRSSYQHAVWLDLDCEVMGPIDALFTQCDSSSKIALARHRHDDLPRFHPDIYYNGGVIIFEHGAKIIELWARETLTRNQCFPGDDFLLSALIAEQRLEITELSDIYHWNMTKGMNLNAVIIHWVGRKNFIKVYGGLKNIFQEFYNRYQ